MPSSSNSSCDGATFVFVEQFFMRWSNFSRHRATLCAKEQDLSSWSNSSCDGATFVFVEQFFMRWSKISRHGATLSVMEQLLSSSSKFTPDGATLRQTCYILIQKSLTFMNVIFLELIPFEFTSLFLCLEFFL